MADLVVANNVLAHVPDINDFVVGIARVLKPDGVISVEAPHLLELIRANQFDTIYHEHYSYLSLGFVDRLFNRHGLRIFDVEKLGTHGGSLRIYGCAAGAGRAPRGSVSAVLNEEAALGLSTLEPYRAFDARVRESRFKLLEFLIGAKRAGKKVWGYGAPAKGNTLLNYCGVRADLIEATVDRSPHKQNRFLPGSHIPVLPPERVAEARPDYLLILAWNLEAEVVSQMAHIRDWGGKFVVPIPEVSVLG
jgi:SAM-dependent methyltransferase